MDLILSSGFLAFARQAGVLSAVEAAEAAGRLSIDGVCGTSSGALAGSLWASGMSAAQVAAELAGQTPLSMVALHLQPWRGLFAMDRVIARLAEVLPPTFEDLPRPFAVGVIDRQGRPHLLRSGPLAPAVAASCAMPYVFRPVEIEGRLWQDGGAKDRLGLDGWRAWRGQRPLLVHLVSPTHGPAEEPPLHDVTLVRTPASGASFLSLGDFEGQRAEAEGLARTALGL
ncbi:MAG: patatin-like phospholipase family protein [Alphaproteobacteria bacterium]|nr:patatin-like phospholipase family protein [Alphaproteobacteria bacterium]